MTVRFRIRPSTRNGLAILALALLAFFLLMVTKAQHAEPKYDGRTVWQWVEAAQSPNPVVATQALASLRSIGTNAIPTLISWMAHRDSMPERQLCELVRSRWAIPWLRSALIGRSEMAYECRAIVGFSAIGSQAKLALPFLERLVRENHPGARLKSLNAAGVYVSIDPSRAEVLAEQWVSSTNADLVTAGNRLKGALRSVGGTLNGPNPQGGENGRQPFGSDTNQTSAAAASRRSP